MKVEKHTECPCPRCQGKVLYRYGMTPAGRQRLQCVLCGRQFSKERKRVEVVDRPVCPACGRPMALYRRTAEYWRFRCSGYPGCKTYIKREEKKKDNELLLASCSGKAETENADHQGQS